MFTRPALLALTLFACAGCASPPSPLDATPRTSNSTPSATKESAQGRDLSPALSPKSQVTRRPP